MNKVICSTNSGQFPLLIDFSVSTNTTKVDRSAKSYHRYTICKKNVVHSSTTHHNCNQNVACLHKDCQKINHDRPTNVTKKRGCDLLVYNVVVLFCAALFILNSLIVSCDGRLFENPHRHQRGIIGGHGHPHQFSGAGILGRDQLNHNSKKDDPQVLAAEERRKMLKEYGVDGVVDVQDVGPDGKRRKKVRLGPIVFDPEAIRFDDLDDYNEYNDGPRSKIGRYDYEENEDIVDRDRLVPSRNGGGLNIINKLMVSLYNFGSFLCKLFSNLYRYMERQAKILNDRMAAKQTDQTSLPSNKEEDHGETSLVVIVIASWLIFGIIVALVTYVVNYWSDFVVGHYDAQEITRISDEDVNVKEAKEDDESNRGNNVCGNGLPSAHKNSSGKYNEINMSISGFLFIYKTHYTTSFFILASSTGRTAIENLTSSSTTPSSHTQSSDVAVTTNLINDVASNRALISSTAERSLPWIPIIGLVSPEESVLFKKLVETSNCSSNEKTSIHNIKIKSSVVPREEEQESVEIELIDQTSDNENKVIKEDSDKTDIADNENEENTTDENLNDENCKEIFNNSILLEKFMQQWRKALNQRAELIAQRSQVRI